jgi:hypothetical protein
MHQPEKIVEALEPQGLREDFKQELADRGLEVRDLCSIVREQSKRIQQQRNLQNAQKNGENHPAQTTTTKRVVRREKKS